MALVRVLVTLVLAAGGSASAPLNDAARRAVAAAEDAQQRGDMGVAVEGWNAAVGAAPEAAELRIQRGFFAWNLGSTEGDSEQGRHLLEVARADFRAAIELEPDSRRGGVARDALRELDGRRLVPARQDPCRGACRVALAEAERAFFDRRYDIALPAYARAVAAAPDSPEAWITWGDAYYQLKEFGKASERYREGLARDPWHRAGHRFLADALAHGDARGDAIGAARREAALAILSDPGYEAGWSSFGDLVEASGGTWRRRWMEKPRVVARAGGGVEMGVEVLLGEERSTTWMTYALARAGALTHLASESEPEPAAAPTDGHDDGCAGPDSPLEVEDRAVRATLAILREGRGVVEPDAPVVTPAEREAEARTRAFWDLIEEGDRRGLRVEAILLLLLDTDLVPEYLEYREGHRDRLIQFLDTVMASPGSAP